MVKVVTYMCGNLHQILAIAPPDSPAPGCPICGGPVELIRIGFVDMVLGAE